MAGYWLVRASSVCDQDAADQCVELQKPVAEKYNAKILASAGRHQTVEGEDKPRNLIIQFPGYQHAPDCYNSPGYHQAMEFVRRAFVCEPVIVEANDQGRT